MGPHDVHRSQAGKHAMLQGCIGDAGEGQTAMSAPASDLTLGRSDASEKIMIGCSTTKRATRRCYGHKSCHAQASNMRSPISFFANNEFIIDAAFCPSSILTTSPSPSSSQDVLPYIQQKNLDVPARPSKKILHYRLVGSHDKKQGKSKHPVFDPFSDTQVYPTVVSLIFHRFHSLLTVSLDIMDDRKKRLAALAARAGRNKADPDSNNNNADNNEVAAAANKDVDANKDTTTVTAPSKKDVKFRNYTPSDPKLLKKEGDDVEGVAADTTDSSSKKRTRPKDANASNMQEQEPPKKKSALEEALEQAKKDLNDDNNNGHTNIHAKDAPLKDLSAIAPKKINWDLKRDIQPKLDRLEKRTQKAIVQMLRERLAREADAAAEEDDGNEEAEGELD